MLKLRGSSLVASIHLGLLLMGCSGGSGDANSAAYVGPNGAAASTSTTVGGGAQTEGGSGSTAVGSSIGGNLGNTDANGGTTAAGRQGYSEPTESLDPNAAPSPIVTVDLEVASDAIQTLDADPFDGPDLIGAFVDDGATRYDPIDVNYRGAYALQTLIRYRAIQRNWKLKFAKDHQYRSRREWNYNYEPNIRQRLTYWLMRLADVKVPSARHVVLRVNGATHGLYLEYEDPDNKSWLQDKFGDDSGDLFKAAYDIPGETAYFATLEVLGQNDSDYEMHYRKKTNNDDPIKATDFSSLRVFIKNLNESPDGEFETFLRGNFNVDRFISYLVVANFVSHWDSLPQRPKNFWLYQVPATGKWQFIPWDMDATFQPVKFTLNPMGTTASVFYQFDAFEEYRGRQAAEGTARPLITRTMKVPAFRSAYIARYREALSTFLARDYLLSQIATLTAIATAAAQPDEIDLLSEAQLEMEQFVNERIESVTAELATQP